MAPHEHKWKLAYTIGHKLVGVECKCGEKMERAATSEEKKKIIGDQKRHEAKMKVMHGVNWEFARKFMDSKKGWKYQSYELMTRVRKWAKKHPKDVIVCGIDDSYNSSSDLVFILHRVGRKLWGTSCYTITQCDGQVPNEWFMYPSHRKGIQKALEAMAGLKSFYKD